MDRSWEKKQTQLGRFVDIGAELFAMSAACGRAQTLLDAGKEDEEELLNKVAFFCKDSRYRIDELFAGIRNNADAEGYRLAKGMLKSE